VRPDLATITLQFSAEGRTPAQAGSRVAAKADSLRRALVALGISKDSLLSGSQWYWWRGRLEILPQGIRYLRHSQPNELGQLSVPMQDTLYRANDAIEVHVRDLSKVGAVIDAALAQGITQMTPVRFAATDVRAVQDALLAEATVRARTQAEAIARASGGELGRARTLSTQDERYRDYDIQSGFVDTNAGGEAPTVVTAPSITVSMTVYGRWELVARSPARGSP